MKEPFKINVYFDEKGEELEELIIHILKSANSYNKKSIEGRKNA